MTQGEAFAGGNADDVALDLSSAAGRLRGAVRLVRRGYGPESTADELERIAKQLEDYAERAKPGEDMAR